MISLALWLFSAWVIASALVWALSIFVRMGAEGRAKSVDGLKPWIKAAVHIFPIGGLEVANALIPAHPDDKAALAKTVDPHHPQADSLPRMPK
jgi:hypothetical protein